MRNICLIFFIILLPWTYVSAQQICNKGPNSWTLLFTDNEIVKIGADTCLEFEIAVSPIVCYALEIKADEIYSHGFIQLQAQPDNNFVFVLQEAQMVPIYLQNFNQETILVEYHRYSFLMQPGESRKLKDLAVGHDYMVNIQFSRLGEGVDLIPFKGTNYKLQWLGNSLWLNF